MVHVVMVVLVMMPTLIVDGVVQRRLRVTRGHGISHERQQRLAQPGPADLRANEHRERAVLLARPARKTMVLLLEPGRARKVDEIEARPQVLGNIFYAPAT